MMSNESPHWHGVERGNVKTSSIRGALALAATALLLGSTITGASAETWRATDAAGDVSASTYDPEPPPCGTSTEADQADDATTDIVGLDAHHRKESVELTARFRDLTSWRNQVVSFAVKTDRRTLAFAMRRDQDSGKVSVDMLRYPSSLAPLPTDGECSSFSILSIVGSCAGLVARMAVGRDVASVAIPRTCLDDPRWIRVGVRSYRFVGESARNDVLIPPGADAFDFPGPFGPKLRRG